jgi:hypothetical protein
MDSHFMEDAVLHAQLWPRAMNTVTSLTFCV